MSNLINKLNLYEFFAILIPGSVVTLELGVILNLYTDICNYCKHLCYCCCCSSYDPMCVLAFFVIAYIVGCMYHLFMDWWWTPFRNNPTHISYVYHRIPKENKRTLTALWGDQNVEGQCFCCLLQCPCIILRSVWMAVLVVFYPVRAVLKCLCCSKCCTETDNAKNLLIDKYYTAYYYAERNRDAAPYSFLEGQIALCRNMILPVLLIPCTLAQIKMFSFLSDRMGLMCGFAVLLFVFVMLRQEKVYSCVMEDYEYTKRMESNYEKTK